MNIPIGSIETAQVPFSEEEPFQKLQGLLESGFNGYLVATAEGFSGMEEGLLMVRGSAIVGAIFDALRLDKQLYGLSALRLVLNLLRAENGVYDVNKLSSQQIDLIIAFNEKVKLPKPIEASVLSKLRPPAYSTELVSRALSVRRESDSKANLLSKLGLGSI